MKKLTGVSYMSQKIGRGFPPATNHSCSMSNCIIMILESHRIIPFHARSTIKTFYVRSEIPNSPFSTHFIKNCSDVGCLVCSHFLSISRLCLIIPHSGENVKKNLRYSQSIFQPSYAMQRTCWIQPPVTVCQGHRPDRSLCNTLHTSLCNHP